jgi:hypothetical protein
MKKVRLVPCRRGTGNEVRYAAAVILPAYFTQQRTCMALLNSIPAIADQRLPIVIYVYTGHHHRGFPMFGCLLVLWRVLCLKLAVQLCSSLCSSNSSRKGLSKTCLFDIHNLDACRVACRVACRALSSSSPAALAAMPFPKRLALLTLEVLLLRALPLCNHHLDTFIPHGQR